MIQCWEEVDWNEGKNDNCDTHAMPCFASAEIVIPKR